MTGRKNRALQVPLVVPYKALEKLPKVLYGTTGGTCSARLFRPVMLKAFHTCFRLNFNISNLVYKYFIFDIFMLLNI